MPPAERGVEPRHALALGLLQGPAELLPISSSAHTALIPWLAGWSYSDLPPRARKDFEVALHAGAGVALGLRLRQAGELECADVDARQAALLLAAIAPAALAGLALERTIELRLGGPGAIAAGLLAGALAMVSADRTSADGARSRAAADWRDGLLLGLAQAAALAPGVSRNGATLAAARALGFSRHEAHALSWTVGLPVIVGPVLLRGARRARRGEWRGQIAGGALGAGAALLSTWLAAAPGARRAIGELPLRPFAVYRGALALLVVAVRSRRAQ